MKRIDAALFAQLHTLALASPRRRSHLNWHDSAHDVVQRFFVHMLPRSYIRPHRHRMPQRFELTVVLDGSADLLRFDDAGTLREITAVAAGAAVRGVELPHDCWHSYRVTGDALTLLEIKPGPYDAAAAKDFAAWAPAEAGAEVPPFLDWLQNARIGDRWPGAIPGSP